MTLILCNVGFLRLGELRMRESPCAVESSSVSAGEFFSGLTNQRNEPTSISIQDRYAISFSVGSCTGAFGLNCPMIRSESFHGAIFFNPRALSCALSYDGTSYSTNEDRKVIDLV